MLRLYRQPAHAGGPQEAFSLHTDRPLHSDERTMLTRIIGGRVYDLPEYSDNAVVEIGPRLAVETPFSSNATAILRSIGLPVSRVERSMRYPLGAYDRQQLVASHLDRMTQEAYDTPPTTFGTGRTPEQVYDVDILGRGEEALSEANKRLGLGMDADDIRYYADMFRRLGRNPTVVEMFQTGNANSEHSRHWFFRGVQVLDGVEMPESLMDVVKKPWQERPGRSLIAFRDNAGVMRGGMVALFVPRAPGAPSGFSVKEVQLHLSATAETHNHPTFIAPFPGAETGAGGRIRDNRAVGRGGLTHAGFAGYCVGNLYSNLGVAGEHIPERRSLRYASPLSILIEGSNGVSDYGNKIGEPLIGGFTRSFGQMVDGQWREFRKPVLYSAGAGAVLDLHYQKRHPAAGMLIVRFGGPAYRIGVGGGAASSMGPSQNTEALDLQSVQRGDAEYENRANRVIQACCELLEGNPIETIHDQGAGGPSNVLTELMEPLGGTVDIRRITLGDKTMSVADIWVAEFQEGYGVLITPERLSVFEQLCKRERVNCEVLGEVTGSGTVEVVDSTDGSLPVDLSLKDILSEMPPKRFASQTRKKVLAPLALPQNAGLREMMRKVMSLPQVGSKGFLVHKVDRSVTGLVARQQCCGPSQLPVANASVKANSMFGLSGVAVAFGEQPNKLLISTKAGARMAVAEMLTNMASVLVTGIGDIRCRVNWMWAAKRESEGSELYRAALAMQDFMCEAGIAIDGGKDSLSMAADIDGQVAIAPGQLVIMGYAPVEDVTAVVTPDLKGGGHLGYIDLGKGKNRLGGSALAQAYGQLGDDTPNARSRCVKRAFNAIQQLIAEGLITAYHDRSDGGLITTIAEMCLSGMKGASLTLPAGTELVPYLFNEEAGMVIEYRDEHSERIRRILREYKTGMQRIGETHDEPGFLIRRGRKQVFSCQLQEIRSWWEATSAKLEALQANERTVHEERIGQLQLSTPPAYELSFTPRAPAVHYDRRPLVAVIREEGTNGDREMAAALYLGGCDLWDIAMSDLREGRVESLDRFRGIVFPGGFSYADVFGSARGWAAGITENPTLRELFGRFYGRIDTFSLGVCNGCQLMAELGWVPYQGLSVASQPRLLHNTSERFESRWSTVEIRESPSILLKDMEGSRLGIWVAHGEGRFSFPDSAIAEQVRSENLAPIAYARPEGGPTEEYPHNPNGSPEGWAALTTPDGRHLAMMPHPERCVLPWQWPWMPEKFRDLKASPWLRMFQNARSWCRSH